MNPNRPLSPEVFLAKDGEQRVELPLRIRPPRPGTSARAAVDPLGREALTCYESLAVYSSDDKIWSLVSARPKTGRASNSGQGLFSV